MTGDLRDRQNGEQDGECDPDGHHPPETPKHTTIEPKIHRLRNAPDHCSSLRKKHTPESSDFFAQLKRPARSARASQAQSTYVRSVSEGSEPLRVLYSFPHKIGADRICSTAWHQVAGLDAIGATVLAYPLAVRRSLPAGIRVQPTVSRRDLRIPYRAVG